jgi:Plasmid encoded RepA protein
MTCGGITSSRNNALSGRAPSPFLRKFYDEIREPPVPINMNILAALKRSPLGLDLYMFLTYRVSYLKKSAFISLKALQSSSGSVQGHQKPQKESPPRAHQDKAGLASAQLRTAAGSDSHPA